MRENHPSRQSRCRFKSVALVDEAALLACIVYVDLNPIRAGIAATPEESAYTSGRDRGSGFRGHRIEFPLPRFNVDTGVQTPWGMVPRATWRLLVGFSRSAVE